MNTVQQVVIGYAILTWAWAIFAVVNEMVIEMQNNPEEMTGISSGDWYVTVFAPIAVPIIFIKMFADKARKDK